MSGRVLGTALLAVAVIAAAIAACEKPRPPRFPHATHMALGVDAGPGQPSYLSCAGCHRGVRKAGEPLDADPSLCRRCHTDVRPSPRAARTSTVRFTHAEHLKRPAIHGQCVACHAGIASDHEATAHPSMTDCLQCHKDAFDQGRCLHCHLDQAELARTPPRTFMRHDTGWIRRHGPSAAAHTTQACERCHTQTFCADCHDTRQPIPVEVRRPEAIGSGAVHRADYVTRHAIEAEAQPAACARCHAPSSCDTCHVARGVSPAAKGSSTPHPRGWAGQDRSSPDFHGRAAKRDILRCASCHDQGPASNCILCHKVGGMGGSPHPAGWSSARNPSLDTPCSYCHAGS